MMKMIKVMVLAFLFYVFGFSSGVNAAIIPSVLVDLANQDRQANNAPRLSANPLLIQAAQMKADDMALKSYFGHTSPEGITPWYWIAKAGYEFIYAGENLGMNYADSKELENAWLDSPKHRENILNPHFTEVGIAHSKGIYQGQEVTFIVQMFGSSNLAGTAPEIQEEHYIFIGLTRFNVRLAI